MLITTLPILEDNYAFILSEGEHAVVIDPGEGEPEQAFLEQKKLTLSAILLTHHHADHVGGVARLKRQFPHIAVYGPANAGASHILQEGDVISLLNLSFEVLALPGHTLSHLGYYCRSLGACFVGDTLFGSGCGRLFEGTPKQMMRSLKKITTLPDETKLYCGHEYTQTNTQFALSLLPHYPPFVRRAEEVERLRREGKPTVPLALVEEKRSNPFLLVGHSLLEEHMQEQRPGVLFAKLRSLRDQF